MSAAGQDGGGFYALTGSVGRDGTPTGSEPRPTRCCPTSPSGFGGTYGVDDVLRRMAAILAQGTGATRVLVWLRVGRELRPAAAWPADVAKPSPMSLGADDSLPAFTGVTRAVAVRHDEQLLGALALEKPRRAAHTDRGQTPTGLSH